MTRHLCFICVGTKTDPLVVVSCIGFCNGPGDVCLVRVYVGKVRTSGRLKGVAVIVSIAAASADAGRNAFCHASDNAAYAVTRNVSNIDLRRTLIKHLYKLCCRLYYDGHDSDDAPMVQDASNERGTDHRSVPLYNCIKYVWD